MDNYIVSARKYRPSTFASVVGQQALTATLRNSIAKNRLAHAYLFCGTRGVGKTSCARIFAKTINCQNPTPQGEACNECESCREFNRGTSLNIIELDAASNNSVNDIRDMIEKQVHVPPVNARYRVFIVDEVHMLSSSAFNAFLKTLEEPPEYVIFILATTEKHKVIPTILSRCQIYDFNRITIQDMVDHLAYVASQEGIEAEEAALNVIARKADGAMRDALSIFDQVAAASSGHVTYQSTIDNLSILDYEYYNRLVSAFLQCNVEESLLIYKEIREKGFDSLVFVNGLAQHLRDLMVAQHPSTIVLLEGSDEMRNRMAETSRQCQPKWLYRAMELCNEADLNYRTATNKQFLVELTLIKLCQLLSPSPDNTGDGKGQTLRRITTPGGGESGAHAPRNTVTDAVKETKQSTAAAPAATAKNDIAAPKPDAPAAPLPPPPATPRGASAKRKIVRVSINKPLETPSDPTAVSASVPEQLRDNQFTDAEFTEAWQGYIEAHPTEKVLINAMRMTAPMRKSGNTFVAVVESEAIRDSIADAMPSLRAHLRESLGNDYVEVNISLNKGTISEGSLTDSELFALLRHEYPELNTFADNLKLKLM